jgi:hypothetical protein
LGLNGASRIAPHIGVNLAQCFANHYLQQFRLKQIALWISPKASSDSVPIR